MFIHHVRYRSLIARSYKMNSLSFSPRESLPLLPLRQSGVLLSLSRPRRIVTVSGCVSTSHVSTNTSGGSVTSHPPQLKRWRTVLQRRQRFSLSLMPSRDTISAPWTRQASCSLRLSCILGDSSSSVLPTVFPPFPNTITVAWMKPQRIPQNCQQCGYL